MLLRSALFALAFAAFACGDRAHGAASAPQGSIHRLGPDARQLRFEGEASARTWAIYVTPAQAQTRARVRLSYSNAISVMPETSRLTIFVNDIQVASDPDRGGERSGRRRRRTAQGASDRGIQPRAHRGLAASSGRLFAGGDLRTLDPARPAASGLTFPELADAGINTLDDLAAISPDASGAVAIQAVAARGLGPGGDRPRSAGCRP